MRTEWRQSEQTLGGLDVERESDQTEATSRGGRNTGFQDALGVFARLLQRGHVRRDEVEEVIADNCRRQGRPAPDGGSMERRVERLRCTFEQSGLVIESTTEGPGRLTGWRVPVRRQPLSLPSVPSWQS